MAEPVTRRCPSRLEGALAWDASVGGWESPQASAMIASNSAVSSCSSAQTSSKNSSSIAGAARAGSSLGVLMSVTTGSGADRLLALAPAADLDLAGLGLLSDGNRQGEHPCVVAGLDPLG